MIRDVTDLEIYNYSLELLKEIYILTSLLPSTSNHLKFQLIRAAESIPALIAEGFAKKKAPKEFCRFLLMALGSSDEVITHLRILALSEASGTGEKSKVLLQEYKLLSKKLNKLHSSWQKFS